MKIKNLLYVLVLIITTVTFNENLNAACNSPETGKEVVLTYVVEDSEGEVVEDYTFSIGSEYYIYLKVGDEKIEDSKETIVTSSEGKDLKTGFTLAYDDGIGPSGDCEIVLDDEPFTYTVVKVDKIEMTVNGNQEDVSGMDIVVLKGAKYTFTAIASPDGASWPTSNNWYGGTVTEPSWTGVKNGEGETIEVTFDSVGSKTLTCKCGANDTGIEVNIEVIEMEIKEVEYTGGNSQDIQTDASGKVCDEKWIKGGTNAPACFIQGQSTEVTVKFKSKPAGKSLSYSTDVAIKGTVDFFSDDVSGGDYDETTASISADLSTTIVVASGSSANAEVEKDSNIDIDWEYKIPDGDDTWYDAASSDNLEYFLVWNTPVSTNYGFKYDILKWATDAADDCSSAKDVVEGVFDKVCSTSTGVYAYDCNQYASDFIEPCKVLGIDVSPVYYKVNKAKYFRMVSNPTVAIGRSTAIAYEWDWHFWASYGGVQYDPTSISTNSGTGQDYENICIRGYKDYLSTEVSNSSDSDANRGSFQPGAFRITPWRRILYL